MASQESNDKFAYLNQLSTEELEALLCADIDSPEDGDDEVIFYILEVIESRCGTAEEREAATEKAWEEFQTYYNTPDYEGKPLYDSSPRETTTPFDFGVHSKSAVQRSRNVRRALIAAAIVAVLVASMTIPVLGYPSVLHMIAGWTTGQFSFQPSGDANSDHDEVVWPDEPRNNFSDLQEALDYYQISEKVVPQAIPEGFQLQEIRVQHFTGVDIIEFNCVYTKEFDNIFILAIYSKSGNNRFYEKDSGEIENYVAGNIVHYILANNNDAVATWYTDDLECSISTTLPIGELKQLIDSIYEGEK
jgi:hypothetical protein